MTAKEKSRRFFTTNPRIGGGENMNPARLEWQIRCEFNACCKRTLRNELIDACRVAVLFFNMTEVEIAEAMKSAIRKHYSISWDNLAST